MDTISQNKNQYEYGLSPPLAPPIHHVVQRRLWNQSYSCFVTEVAFIHFRDTTNGDAEFVADIKPVLSLLSVHKGIGEDDTQVRTPPDKWWRAQCAFRGLTPNGDLEAVQNLLRRGGDLGMTLELKKLKAEMAREYVRTNKSKAEGAWAELGDDIKAKAEFWPRRLMLESFFSWPSSVPISLATPLTPTTPTKKDVLRIEIRNWASFEDKIVKAVDKLPIHFEVVEMHYHRGGERLLIIGPNKDIVDSVERVFALRKTAATEALADFSGSNEGFGSPTPAKR